MPAVSAATASPPLRVRAFGFKSAIAFLPRRRPAAERARGVYHYTIRAGSESNSRPLHPAPSRAAAIIAAVFGYHNLWEHLFLRQVRPHRFPSLRKDQRSTLIHDRPRLHTGDGSDPESTPPICPPLPPPLSANQLRVTDNLAQLLEILPPPLRAVVRRRRHDPGPDRDRDGPGPRRRGALLRRPRRLAARGPARHRRGHRLRHRPRRRVRQGQPRRHRAHPAPHLRHPQPPGPRHRPDLPRRPRRLRHHRHHPRRRRVRQEHPDAGPARAAARPPSCARSPASCPTSSRSASSSWTRPTRSPATATSRTRPSATPAGCR